MSKKNPKSKKTKGDSNQAVAKSKSKFERVEPGLFRYRASGVFYSVIKQEGKTRWKNLHTTDKPTARRILSQEREGQKHLDSNLSGLEFGELTEKYLAAISGKAPKTIATRRGVINRLLAHIPGRTKVRDIQASVVQAWAAGLLMKERSSNEYVRVAKEVFKLAIDDRAILTSPAAGIRRKKLKTIDRRTPTRDQFSAIVADIRAQQFSAHAKDSADFIEFMGLAGLGQAELRNLRLCDIQEERVRKEIKEGAENRIEVSIVRRMVIRRQKTGRSFVVPVYPQVETLLLKLVAQASASEPQTIEEKAAIPLRRLFRIKDGKKALEAACRRLGYSLFDQRSMRRMFITRAVEKGLDFKVIAATQGHNDGGVLVAKTYSHLRPEHFEEMAAKLT